MQNNIVLLVWDSFNMQFLKRGPQTFKRLHEVILFSVFTTSSNQTDNSSDFMSLTL